MFDDCQDYVNIGLFFNESSVENKNLTVNKLNCDQVEIKLGNTDINFFLSYDGGPIGHLKIKELGKESGFENVILMGHYSGGIVDDNPKAIFLLRKEDAEELDRFSYFSLMTLKEGDLYEYLTCNVEAPKDSCSNGN